MAVIQERNDKSLIVESEGGDTERVWIRDIER